MQDKHCTPVFVGKDTYSVVGGCKCFFQYFKISIQYLLYDKPISADE